MVFKYVIITLFLPLLFISESFAEKNKLKEILKNDHIKQGAKRSQVQKKVKQTQKMKGSKGIVGKSDLRKVIKNLWLIRNNFVLKWDKKLPDYGLKDTISEIFLAFGVKGFKYKVLFVHTNLITHQMIQVSGKEFIFIVSKVFAEQLDLSKQEISLLLLESYVRATNDMHRTNFREFSPKKGENLKEKINQYIEENLKHMDSEIFNYQGSFESEDIVLKNIFNGLSSKKNFLKIYKRMLGKINELLRNDARFKYFSSRFPSPEIKLNWLEGMNVK